MNTKFLLMPLLAVALVSCQSAPQKTANAGGWECTAKNLQSGSYTGGDYAYIHLSAYNNGGNYKVDKVSSNEVVGTTKDNTPFRCVLKVVSN